MDITLRAALLTDCDDPQAADTLVPLEKSIRDVEYCSSKGYALKGRNPSSSGFSARNMCTKWVRQDVNDEFYPAWRTCTFHVTNDAEADECRCTYSVPQEVKLRAALLTDCDDARAADKIVSPERNIRDVQYCSSKGYSSSGTYAASRCTDSARQRVIDEGYQVWKTCTESVTNDAEADRCRCTYLIPMDITLRAALLTDCDDPQAADQIVPLEKNIRDVEYCSSKGYSFTGTNPSSNPSSSGMDAASSDGADAVSADATSSDGADASSKTARRAEKKAERRAGKGEQKGKQKGEQPALDQ